MIKKIKELFKKEHTKEVKKSKKKKSKRTIKGLTKEEYRIQKEERKKKAFLLREEEKKREEEFELKKRQEKEKEKKELEIKRLEEFDKRQKQTKNIEKKKKYETTENNKYDMFGIELLDLEQGMQITIEILSKDSEFYIGLDKKSFVEVFLPKTEITKEVSIGDSIDVLVYRKTNDEFHVSEKRLSQKNKKDELQKLKLEKKTIYGEIISFNNDMFEVLLENKMNATIHISKLTLHFTKNSDIFIGKNLDFLIKSIRRGSEIELTRIPILKEEQKNNIKEIEQMDSIVVGRNYVKNKAGIVFEVLGQEIFISYANISHNYVTEETNLDDYINDETLCKIIRIQQNKFGYSISASIKNIEDDPIIEFENNFKIGDEVDGYVNECREYGLMIAVGKITGLLHINDSSINLDDYSVGDKISVVISGIDTKSRKIKFQIN